jgi:hypothetical protein
MMRPYTGARWRLIGHVEAFTKTRRRRHAEAPTPRFIAFTLRRSCEK